MDDSRLQGFRGQTGQRVAPEIVEVIGAGNGGDEGFQVLSSGHKPLLNPITYRNPSIIDCRSQHRTAGKESLQGYGKVLR